MSLPMAIYPNLVRHTPDRNSPYHSHVCRNFFQFELSAKNRLPADPIKMGMSQAKAVQAPPSRASDGPRNPDTNSLHTWHPRLEGLVSRPRGPRRKWRGGARV